MLEHWSFVEADMLREYRIDLIAVADTMTWRKFQVLLTGLSPDALFRHATKTKTASQDSSGLGPTDDPEEIKRRIQQMRK